MARRQKKMRERFTAGYKKSKTEHINTLFSMLIGETHNGKLFTVHMITNWIYGRNENPLLDDAFERLMSDVDPIGLKDDQEKVSSIEQEETVAA